MLSKKFILESSTKTFESLEGIYSTLHVVGTVFVMARTFQHSHTVFTHRIWFCLFNPYSIQFDLCVLKIQKFS